MLKSSEIALKFQEEKLPPLPGLDSILEVRGVIALHLEKTLFNEHSPDKYKKNINTVLDDLNILDTDRQLEVIKMADKYDAFLKTLIGHLYEAEKQKIVAEGTFEYPKKRYIYFDKDDDQWCVDVETLQEGDARYDNILLNEGQVIYLFNPTEDSSPLIVRTGEVKIREHDNSRMNMMHQMLIQVKNCTCNKTPCTCGAVTGPTDEDEEEEKQYEEWDILMEKAKDRDVILVFQDGEEIMRF